MQDAAEIGRDSGNLERLALAVASGATVRTAAADIGVSERVAYGISPTDEFKKRVAEIRTEVASVAVGRLTSAATQAVDTLIELLSASNDPKDRLAASKLILSNLGPISEHAELRERLERLEQGT